MQIAFFAVILVSSLLQTAIAARNHLKPTDFDPLTSLPWKRADAKLNQVIERVFREPNTSIRYPVLAEYLRIIPVEQLGKAFDLCIDLEGTQTPDDLVEFFLEIWAKRDPNGCWGQTKRLFRLVGIEEGWLSFDSWKGRPRITVRDLDAIRASRFWLQSRSLLSFPIGVDESALSKEERVRLLKDFADNWFAAFASWPGYLPTKRPWQQRRNYDDEGRELMEMFNASLGQLRSYINQAHYVSDGPAVEVALRRWLQAEPGSALDVMKTIPQIKWTPMLGSWSQEVSSPSTELLVVWANLDLPGLTRWVKGLDAKENVGLRGFLMSRVDALTRERWLADAKSENPDGDLTEVLLDKWAGWEPKAALDAAIATKDIDIFRAAADAAASGPFPFALNSRHFGLGVIKEFDVTKLPDDLRKEIVFGEGWYMMMETWGDIDIGEAARYGLDFMLRTSHPPRENLIKLFNGDDAFASDGDMIDRTFCALRVWAVVQPKEMQTWIDTIKDPDLQKALTWLLQNPWGGPSMEK